MQYQRKRLLSGDPDRILRSWQEKRQEGPEEDLSDRLQLALGSWPSRSSG